jgi:hypothetical protein
MKHFCLGAWITMTVWTGGLGTAEAAKPTYVWARAFHILPETHSDESGYYSLCEGLDGTIYIGTAKYNHNA